MTSHVRPAPRPPVRAQFVNPMLRRAFAGALPEESGADTLPYSSLARAGGRFVLKVGGASSSSLTAEPSEHASAVSRKLRSWLGAVPVTPQIQEPIPCASC